MHAKIDSLHKASLAELKDRFSKTHKILWDGGRRDPVTAFDEFTKILFAKVFAELRVEPGQPTPFERRPGEARSVTACRIRTLYNEARVTYPNVFDTDVDVSDDALDLVVEQLAGVSLVASDLDAPGKAFEVFLGDVFKAELGQYLTPRQVVQTAIAMLQPQPQETVVDPACGSGGFLLYTLEHVRSRLGSVSPAEYASKHLTGVELNVRLAHLAKVTMVLHGDGHSNIKSADSLIGWPELTAATGLRPGTCGVVMTNPPFGGVVSEETTLQQYDLGSKSFARRAQKTELLFLERCIDLLQDTGRLGIVLPDSILTNVSLQPVREYVLSRCHVLAVVSLPIQTFAPAGIGVKASLLALERRRSGDNSIRPAFMALPQHVGYDATGRLDTDSLPVVASLFGEEERQRVLEPICYEIEEARLASRMDPFYHQPQFTVSIDIRLAQSKYRVATLSELVESISGGATPTAKGAAYVDAQLGVPLLRIQNIREGRIDLADSLYIDRSVHIGALARSMLAPGDVLLTITGRIGTAAVVPPELGEANINQHIVRLRPRTDLIHPAYLEAVLNSRICQAQMERVATGATRPALDYSSLRTIRIPVPPMDLQVRLAERVKSMRAGAEELRNKADTIVTELQTVVERAVLEV